jgi:hypothetical protein
MATRLEQEQRSSRDSRDTADLPHQARNREEAVKSMVNQTALASESANWERAS